MENAVLNIYHKIVHEWANAVLTPIHTVAITTDLIVLKGCSNGVHTYGNTKTTTVM